MKKYFLVKSKKDNSFLRIVLANNSEVVFNWLVEEQTKIITAKALESILDALEDKQIDECEGLDKIFEIFEIDVVEIFNLPEMKIIDLKDSPYNTSTAKIGFDSVSTGKVILKSDSKKIMNTPHCIEHGGMNKVDKQLWRCFTCNVGAYQVID